MVDWQVDLEKKLNNLARKFSAEVTGAGDADVLLDEPVISVDENGATVILLKPPKKKSSTRKKKASTDAAKSTGDDTGDD